MKVTQPTPFQWLIFVIIILALLAGESIVEHLLDMAFLSLNEFFIFLGILVCFIFYIKYRLKNK